MRLIVATLLLVASLAACDSKPKRTGVTVEGAMIHLPPVRGRPGAAYFTLRSGSEVRLVSVTSPAIERIELHESVTKDGVSRMGRTQQLSFDGELEFKPGGKHAMLFGLDPTLKPGANVQLTFNFEQAPAVTVQATVHAFGGGGHSGH
jgi:copper(I)-binding protein